MKGEERELLVIQKVNEGKSFERAKEEVKRDIDFIKGFKERKRQIKSEIKILERQQKLLDKRFKESLKKFSKEEKKKEKKLPNLTNGKFANTNHLNRILNVLKYEKENMNKTKIADLCMLNTSQTQSALLFLCKNNLIEKDKGIYNLK